MRSTKTFFTFKNLMTVLRALALLAISRDDFSTCEPYSRASLDESGSTLDLHNLTMHVPWTHMHMDHTIRTPPIG